MARRRSDADIACSLIASSVALATSPSRSRRASLSSPKSRYWPTNRLCSTSSALTDSPVSRVTGPVSSRRRLMPTTSTAMTPSTSWPVRAFHISAAVAAVASKRGDRLMLRHSLPGSRTPQMVSTSLSIPSTAVGSTRSWVGVKSLVSKEPSSTSSWAACRYIPEPARISALFAANNR